MKVLRHLKRYLPGQGGDDDSPYRCVRCGAGFDMHHQECPECGVPFVTKVEPGSDTGEDERLPFEG